MTIRAALCMVAGLVTALACAPRVEHATATPTIEPACAPILIDEAAEFTMVLMRERDWLPTAPVRMSMDRWPSASLVFEHESRRLHVTLEIPPSEDQVEAAFAVPTRADGRQPERMTDDELAGLGERALGLTHERVTNRRFIAPQDGIADRSTITRGFQLTFVRCGVVVELVGDVAPKRTVLLARELDERLTARACC